VVTGLPDGRVEACEALVLVEGLEAVDVADTGTDTGREDVPDARERDEGVGGIELPVELLDLQPEQIAPFLLSFELIELPFQLVLEDSFIEGHGVGISDDSVELHGVAAGLEELIECLGFELEPIALL
jgi:hypothetical protein